MILKVLSIKTQLNQSISLVLAGNISFDVLLFPFYWQRIKPVPDKIIYIFFLCGCSKSSNGDQLMLK